MAARRKQTKAEEARGRIAHLIALDAFHIVRRLTTRADEMVTIFSQRRSREPLLETLASRFDHLRFEDVVQLDIPAQDAVSAFYELLDEVRWYARYTEDMPLQVRRSMVGFQSRLTRARDLLMEALQLPLGQDGPVVVDVEVVHTGPPSPIPAPPALGEGTGKGEDRGGATGPSGTGRPRRRTQ